MGGCLLAAEAPGRFTHLDFDSSLSVINVLVLVDLYFLLLLVFCQSAIWVRGGSGDGLPTARVQCGYYTFMCYKWMLGLFAKLRVTG